GPGQMAFSPRNLTAAVGDEIIFQFQSNNHSVTQSTFANPCQIQTTPSPGIDSLFHFVGAGSTEIPVWSFTVRNLVPMWFFCAQTNPVNHCQHGMVFSLNANEEGSESFAAFQARAIASSDSSSSSSAASSPAILTSSASAASSTTPSNAGSPLLTPTAGMHRGTDSRLIPTSTCDCCCTGPRLQLAFSPTNVTAAVGDTIQFQFQSKNHSVTQSTFANPCQIQTSPSLGIDSGFQFVAAGSTELPQWSFTLQDIVPLWFFCAQTIPANHCQHGMVFSLNANEEGSESTAAFQARALASGDGSSSSSAASSSSVASSSAFRT
ncbi:hypothetical protein B0H14DRAFT_2301620, partial [Mycena olivaceomarginata]